MVRIFDVHAEWLQTRHEEPRKHQIKKEEHARGGITVEAVKLRFSGKFENGVTRRNTTKSKIVN